MAQLGEQDKRLIKEVVATMMGKWWEEMCESFVLEQGGMSPEMEIRNDKIEEDLTQLTIDFVNCNQPIEEVVK